jgi:hypothetical protein
MSFSWWYTLPTSSVEGVGRVSKSDTGRTFVVDGSGDSFGPSSGFGDVDGDGSLHPQCGLVSVQLGHLGIKGCLLTDKIIMVLRCPPLDIDGVLRASVMVMGLVGVTMLHPQGLGDPELHSPPLAPEAVLSSSEDSSRVMRREGDPLWTIPINIAPESHS